jgi:hypothetical protein
MRLIRKLLIRIATWRLHRQLDELEARYLELSADHHRHLHREVD